MSEPKPVAVLIRHGETEWSRSGQHTSRTDLDLTDRGEDQALALAAAGWGEPFGLVLASPRKRARRTAELAGLTPYELDDDLREWDYGAFEGLTSEQIHARFPGWTVWDGPWVAGETPDDVATRIDRVVRRIRASGADRVAVVAHAHILRVLAARWAGQPVNFGRFLALDTATVSELGWEHDLPVVHRWNRSVEQEPTGAT